MGVEGGESGRFLDPSSSVTVVVDEGCSVDEEAKIKNKKLLHEEI